VYFRTLYLRSTKVRRYLRSTKVQRTKVRKYNYFVRRYESTFESTFVREITSSTRTYNVHVRCTCTRTVHYTCRTRAGLSFRPTDTTNIRKEEGGCVHEASKQELMNNTAPSSGLFSFSATRRRDARACACICIDGMVGGSPPLKGGRGRVGRWVGRSARRTERPEASVPSSPRAPNPQRRRRASSSSS